MRNIAKRSELVATAISTLLCKPGGPFTEGKLSLLAENHKSSSPKQLRLVENIACNRIQRLVCSCPSNVLQSLGFCSDGEALQLTALLSLTVVRCIAGA